MSLIALILSDPGGPMRGRIEQQQARERAAQEAAAELAGCSTRGGAPESAQAPDLPVLEQAAGGAGSGFCWSEPEQRALEGSALREAAEAVGSGDCSAASKQQVSVRAGEDVAGTSCSSADALLAGGSSSGADQRAAERGASASRSGAHSVGGAPDGAEAQLQTEDSGPSSCSSAGKDTRCADDTQNCPALARKHLHEGQALAGGGGGNGPRRVRVK